MRPASRMMKGEFNQMSAAKKLSGNHLYEQELSDQEVYDDKGDSVERI